MTVEIGQVWRSDETYLCRVIAFDSRGWPYVRHVNAKQGGFSVNPAWFDTDVWQLVKQPISSP